MRWPSRSFKTLQVLQSGCPLDVRRAVYASALQSIYSRVGWLGTIVAIRSTGRKTDSRNPPLSSINPCKNTCDFAAHSATLGTRLSCNLPSLSRSRHQRVQRERLAGGRAPNHFDVHYHLCSSGHLNRRRVSHAFSAAGRDTNGLNFKRRVGAARSGEGFHRHDAIVGRHNTHTSAHIDLTRARRARSRRNLSMALRHPTL